MKETQTDTASKIAHSWLFMLLPVGLALISPATSLAQAESPLPGNNPILPNQYMSPPITKTTDQTATISAPIPGNTESSPVPGQANVPAAQPISNAQPGIITPPNFSSPNSDSSQKEANSIFTKQEETFPVTLGALQALTQKKKNDGTDTTEESLNKYLSWLDGLIKAHNKLASAFAKENTTKAACNNEHKICKQLFEIKDQILYLKAHMLIKEKRWPEAVKILVDITVVEPNSVLGQQAYRSLKETGFSPQLPEAAAHLQTKNNVHQSQQSHQPHPSLKTLKAKKARTTVHQSF